MRWKLWWRRLSVSAPRVIVRSHLPWPLRWAVVALVLGFSAALALWALETGRDLAGLDRHARHELADLREQVQTLRAERDRAQSVAAAADSLLRAGQAAQDRLAQELRSAQDRQQALEADLGFFQRLLPAVDGAPLQLRALQADATMPGQLRYQMLVMQPGKAPSEFQGQYQVVLSGRLDGRPWRSDPPEGGRPLTLRHYARVEGLIDHPVAVVLQTVQVRVVDGDGGVLATETLRLP